MNTQKISFVPRRRSFTYHYRKQRELHCPTRACTRVVCTCFNNAFSLCMRETEDYFEAQQTRSFDPRNHVGTHL